MGFFTQGAKNKLNAAGEKFKEAPGAAKEKLADLLKRAGVGTINQLDKRTKGLVLGGKCAGCQKSLKGSGEEYYHNKCAGRALSQVARWKSNHEINLTNHCPSCETNLLTTHKWNRPDCCRNA